MGKAARKHRGIHQIGINRWNVALIKAKYATPLDSIKENRRSELQELRPHYDSHKYWLYLRQSVRNPSEWVNVFADLSEDKVDATPSIGNSGLLFIEVEQRIFAIIFGHARSLIKPEAIEDGFGFNVANRIIDPSTVDSIEFSSLCPMLACRQVAAV